MVDLFLTISVLVMYFSGCWACFRWGRYEFYWKEESLKRHLDHLKVQNSNLSRKLLEAEKNDKRDPKTGRYTK